MRRALVLSLLVALTGVPAASQPVDQATAARQLFGTRGVELALSRALDETERAIVRAMVTEADRTGQSFRFYGSIAYAPDEGLQSEALQGAFNFHSTAAADAAALAACNAARSGGAACQVAAHVLPRGYAPGRMQLSYDATRAFRSTYRRVRGEKAFAISQATGAWQMAEGSDAPGTAVALCNETAAAMRGPADCVAVIAD